MATQCTPTQLPFHPLGRREVVARFDAGHLTSDGRALLLREADLRLGLTRRIAACSADGRQSGRVEHGVEELVAQRVHGLAQGSRLPARPSGVRAGSAPIGVTPGPQHSSPGSFVRAASAMPIDFSAPSPTIGILIRRSKRAAISPHRLRS